MPTIQKFIVESFKGIERAEIDISIRSNSPVITLIGLNESGKTTILEALSHFVTGDETVASLFEDKFFGASALNLIPMHRKAAFTGKIKIQALVKLDENDVEVLRGIVAGHGLELNDRPLREPFAITRDFSFEDSNFKKTGNMWGFSLQVKTPRAKAFKKYSRPSSAGQVDVWLECADYIESKLETVAYFPTFLVDIPERIYLQEYEGETPINRHYRFVFQDILNSLGEGLSLEKHVCERIKGFKKKEGGSSWLSLFLGSPSKTPVDSVFQKLSGAITKEVLGSWRRIFQRSISASGISVEWNVDSQNGDIPYATFTVSDGESRYAINERSLGFRWFFSFLLFTAFKKASKTKTLFIFDEPAANLHAKAQAELLTSFSRIASDGNKIIYSTHSHHMINPRWLGAAYIVENSALDYDKLNEFDFDSKPTKISAIPYRKFLADYPTRSSYFQPVIERLDYVPPEIVADAPYLIVEGISDYYAFELAKKITGKNYSFSLMPGVGSTSSGPLLSILLGQGQKFHVLLDDDSEGRKAAERYKSEWYLTADSVYTLGDIDKSFAGKALEKILSSDDLEIISKHLSISGKPTKKQIGWYISEAAANSSLGDMALSSDTILNLSRVLDVVDKKFSSDTSF